MVRDAVLAGLGLSLYSVAEAETEGVRLLVMVRVSSRSIDSMPARRVSNWSILRSLDQCQESGRDIRWNRGRLYYCDDIRTRCRASLGRWPSPELLQALLAVLQLEHGVSLSQRICRGVMNRPCKNPGRVAYLAESALVALQKAGPGAGG